MFIRGMATNRNYQAEYQRRIASAAKRGLSRSQGRGHARVGEARIRSRPLAIDKGLEAALRALRVFHNQAAAAKYAGVSPERFRRFLREHVVIEGRGPDQKISDNLSRPMTVITDGQALALRLRDFDQASLNGRHQAAVANFLTSNECKYLDEFEGQSVIDTKGKAYPLETDPTAIYRLAAQGGDVFHEIYKLISDGD